MLKIHVDLVNLWIIACCASTYCSTVAAACAVLSAFDLGKLVKVRRGQRTLQHERRSAVMCVFSSRERGDNLNVISNTGHAREFGSEVAEDCRQISMHARSHT